MSHKLRKAIALIIITPILGLVVWYSALFLPHLGELRDISSRGRASLKNVESGLYPLVAASETKEDLRSYALRQAYHSLVYDKNRGGMVWWHANNLLWYGASYIHFNDQDIFGIWADCALLGCDHGLMEIAGEYFGKELAAFTEKELANLVGVVRNPTRFAPGSEAGERRAIELLEKAKTQKNALNTDTSSRILFSKPAP